MYGAGKSTLALELALQLEREGKTACQHAEKLIPVVQNRTICRIAQCAE
jgi:hypothetical protein